MHGQSYIKLTDAVFCLFNAGLSPNSLTEAAQSCPVSPFLISLKTRFNIILTFAILYAS